MDHRVTFADNIVTQLKSLGEKSDQSKETKNKTICRMVNIQLRDFFDDIYIPYHYFRKAEWKISKVLYNNEDSLFYNEKYLTPEDKNRFYEVFDKFVNMIEEILSTENKLHTFLEKWTDTSDIRWRSLPTKSYLKSVLTKKEYQVISPLYVTNLYCELNAKYKDDKKVKKILEDHLDEVIKNVKKEMREFKKIYNSIVDSYTYEYPLDESECTSDIYVKGFINSVILASLDYVEKLLDLNIYAVNPMVMDIIGFYTPLNEINTYDPSENDGRKLYIV